jgi:hypothetical protein
VRYETNDDNKTTSPFIWNSFTWIVWEILPRWSAPVARASKKRFEENLIGKPYLLALDQAFPLLYSLVVDQLVHDTKLRFCCVASNLSMILHVPVERCWQLSKFYLVGKALVRKRALSIYHV